MPVACPKCHRNVPEKKACLYCGAPLDPSSSRVAPAAPPAPPSSAPPEGLSSAPPAPLVHSSSAYVVARNADTLLAEAAAFAREGKADRALASLDSALKLRPSDAKIWIHRGVQLATLLRFDEALAALDRAIALDPASTEAGDIRRGVEADPRRALPPGRPGPSRIELLADGGPSDLYAMNAASAIYDPSRLARWSGPEDVAALNWIVTLPPPRERRGRKWSTGRAAEAGLMFTAIGRDRSGFLFRYAATGHELPDDALPPTEIDALAAILEGGALACIGVCANKPFSAGLQDRVRWVNGELDLLGVEKGARIELVVVDDPHAGFSASPVDEDDPDFGIGP
ncbi:MAG: hypothetical protein JST00_25590 [Deltaproteobacteria bacterium]|nr:hypothetical protein [Deltaproteobacteria bacterium]